MIANLPVSGADRISPKSEPLSPEETNMWITRIKHQVEIEKSIVIRGLSSDNVSFQIDCVKYLAKHGTVKDIHYLIDLLSDLARVDGGKLPVRGMHTVRFWANIALISITQTSYDYRWDDSILNRENSILLWQQHWNLNKPKEKQ